MGKAVNPATKVLMYVNSQFAYPYYNLYDIAKRNGYWVLNQTSGKPFTHEVINYNCSKPGHCPGTTVGYWDFGHEELRSAWVAACSNPRIDGCFIDGAESNPPFGPDDNTTGYEAARSATFTAMAAKALIVINDKKYYDPAPPYPDAQGEFIETFSGSAYKWIDILNRTQKGHLVQAHTGSRNDGVCHQPNSTEGIKDLAAFLMVAEQYSYFGCSNWEDVPTWPSVYDMPLGEPLGPAVKDAAGTWQREFTHGTTCRINFETGEASIKWGKKFEASSPLMQFV